jgi:hypothetical protein
MSVEAELVPGTGLEPVRSCLRGIFVLATAFAAHSGVVWSLDFLFVVFRGPAMGRLRKLDRGRQVSTLSHVRHVGLARDCRHAA